MANPKNHAIVTDGVVVNIIWVRPAQAREFGAIMITNDLAGIGWQYVDGEFLPPEVPAEEAPNG